MSYRLYGCINVFPCHVNVQLLLSVDCQYRAHIHLKHRVGCRSFAQFRSCSHNSDSSFTDRIFTFSPSSEALSQFPALGDNWNKKNESQYLNNLKIKIPDDLPITLSLTNSSSSVHGDSITYIASYSLSTPFSDATIPTNYQGELIFELIRDSRFVWSIYFWRDIKRSNSPSWSELKGRFY